MKSPMHSQIYIYTAIVIQQQSQLVEFLCVEAFSRCNCTLYGVKQNRVFNVILVGIVHFLVELIPELAKYTVQLCRGRSQRNEVCNQ